MADVQTLWFERRFMGERSFFHATADGMTTLCYQRLNPRGWQLVAMPSAPPRLFLCRRCAKVGGFDVPDTTTPAHDPDPRFTTYIYVISQGEYYKIGIADDVRVRFRDLQCANPQPLKLEYCSPACTRRDARRIESSIHHRLDHCRAAAPYQREWFRFVGGARDVIATIEEHVSAARIAV